MTITNSPVNKILYRLASVAVTALLSSQLTIAADITSELGANGQPDVIRIKGPLNLRDGDKFRSLALASPKATVYLDSPGGRVSPAIEIGTIIRLKGFETAVEEGQCSSACALIWLAGEPRFACGSSWTKDRGLRRLVSCYVFYSKRLVLSRQIRRTFAEFP